MQLAEKTTSPSTKAFWLLPLNIFMVCLWHCIYILWWTISVQRKYLYIFRIVITPRISTCDFRPSSKQVTAGVTLLWLFSSVIQTQKILCVILPWNWFSNYVLSLAVLLPENILLFDHNLLAHNTFSSVPTLANIL